MDKKITLDQIRNVVEEVVEQKLEEKLEQKLDEEFKKELAPINKTLKKIQKDLKGTFVFADKNYLVHEKRLQKVETILSLRQTL